MQKPVGDGGNQLTFIVIDKIARRGANSVSFFNCYQSDTHLMSQTDFDGVSQLGTKRWRYRWMNGFFVILLNKFTTNKVSSVQIDMIIGKNEMTRNYS